MTQAEQQKAAAEFAAEWKNKGDEKQHSQKFWIGLLNNVLGTVDATKVIDFEERVKVGSTKFIDGYIAETGTIIEQKGAKIDLDKAEKQSDGAELTPFVQAKRYDDNLPRSKKARWIVVSNFREIRVHDMEKAEPAKDFERILLADLPREYYRLQFLVDAHNENIRREEDLSVQAGQLVKPLFDALYAEYIPPENAAQYRTKDNPNGLSPAQLGALNILCVRIVFCLYAEDAGLFATRTSFEDYIQSFAVENVRKGIIELFRALDTPKEARDKYDTKIAAFPYVNGGLFLDENIEIPNFTQNVVDVIVNECAPFNWAEISPTIFGAVFESTLNPETRRKGGMHYTSIQNIHRVIDPLFLDALNAELAAITGAALSLNERRSAIAEFQEKIAGLKFLDPACGSGNFLTESYLSLAKLEIEALEATKDAGSLGLVDGQAKVSIAQFYGIEINDFAVTVAKTALWIAESQVNALVNEILNKKKPTFPLKTSANIVEGNALRLDWATLAEYEDLGLLFTEKLNIFEKAPFNESLEIHEPTVEEAALIGRHFKELNVVAKEVEYKIPPKNEEPEPIVYDYIIGNPPFVGYGLQSEQQKGDTLKIYSDENEKPYKTAGKIDYVANWYFKAARLIQNTKTRCAFVSTNSITQGEQVASVWKPIFERFKIHFDFAYKTFKWENENADKKNMAAVHCVIIGFSHAPNEKPKQIFSNEAQSETAKNISPYIIDSPTVWIENRAKPLCTVPRMTTGNRPADGGHLIIEGDEYEDFIKKEPNAQKWIKKLTGAEEYINGKARYCLWLVGASPAEIKKMPLVYKRVQLCREDRLNGAEDRQKLADTPALFRELNNPEQYLIIPRVSSENRRYIPIGFLNGETIPTDSATIITHAGLYEFGVLTSSVHMAWMRAVCGRLKSDYRYSKDVVYNNFVWCNSTDAQKAKIEETAQAILDARAKYPDSSLADLYDETLMPSDLRRAHRENDAAVMKAYGFAAKMTESEIVSELFKLYEKLTK